MPTMENDKNALAEKIIRDIVNVLTKDSDLTEFDIIPIAANLSNKSPVVHVQHRLGLESWCVRHVYGYIHARLRGPRRSQRGEDYSTRDGLLRVSLLINPDVATHWNRRRELLIAGLLNTAAELSFSRIVLSRKSKCNEALAYRRWLLMRFIPGLDSPTLLQVQQQEVLLMQMCVCKSPNNYHAWNHRIWFLNYISEFLAPTDMAAIIFREHSLAEDWMSSNISDHSGLHYRQYTLKQLYSMNDRNFFSTFKSYKALNQFLLKNVENSDREIDNMAMSEKDVLNLILGVILDQNYNNLDKCTIIYQNINYSLYELHLNEELSRLYTSHEALWYHRRFALQHLVNSIFDYFGESKINFTHMKAAKEFKRNGSSLNITQYVEEKRKTLIDEVEDFSKEAKILRCDNHSVYCSLLYKALVNNERTFIDQQSKCGDVFSIKYDKWLRCVLGFFV